MGDTVIDSFDDNIARACTWDYIVSDATRENMRIGQISAVWDKIDDSSPALIADQYSDDIGDTSGVSFNISKSGSTVQLICTVVSGTWFIDGERRWIGVT